jgi:hypothetical protein
MKRIQRVEYEEKKAYEMTYDDAPFAGEHLAAAPKESDTKSGIAQQHRTQVTAQEATVGDGQKGCAPASTAACATDVSKQRKEVSENNAHSRRMRKKEHTSRFFTQDTRMKNIMAARHFLESTPK